MILSSDNIFLPGSMEERTQDFGQEIIKKYFEYGWWHLPTPSDIDDISCMHSLIYHTSSRIKDIIQLRKTLLRVIKFYRPGTREIIYGSKTTKGVYADAALLVDDGKKIFSEKRGVFITEGVFHRIKEGYLVNAIIATRSKPPMVPMVIGNAGQDMGRVDIRSVFAVVMWTILRHKKTDASLTLVGDIDEITSNVSHVLENNAHEYDAFYPDFAWRFVRSDAKKALSATFPFVCACGGARCTICRQHWHRFS